MLIEGFKKIIFTVLVFVLTALSGICAPLKIHDLLFDNSDNIIFFKTVGEAQSEITKGVLTSPERVYFDIPNSVLSTPSRSWNLRNSLLDEIKISQFSLNPDIVRVVVKYKKDYNPNNIAVLKNANQLILKYSNSQMAQGFQYETVYRNFEDKNTSVFELTKAELYIEPIKPVSGDGSAAVESDLSQIFSKTSVANFDKEYKLSSKFYASKVTNTGNGLMLTGLGNISLKPILTLDNPARLVFDVSNAVLAQDLRNKTFIFTPSCPQTAAQLEARDILRLGQFDKNTVRIVIQGQGAKDYRAAVSPDLQNLFIAKRQTVVSTKLTQNSARVENYAVQNLDDTLSLLTINFNAPLAFSIFEEGKQLHIDMQNVADYNPLGFSALTQNTKFTNIKATKIASEKTRISIPLKDNLNLNAQISTDGKSFRIYFKELPPPVVQPKEPIIQKSDPSTIIEEPKLRPKPAVISNYYKVVLDPGHGGSDCGAIRGGINEKDINLALMKLIRANLEKQKVKVEVTRDNDKSVSLADRVDFSENLSPDIFVSLHVNASVKEDIYGIETHWWREESVELAKKIHASMASDKNVKNWETKDRGLFKSQFYVINHTTMPAVLLEIGFMSNPKELASLNTKERQEELAKSISDGIMDYLKSRGK